MNTSNLLPTFENIQNLYKAGEIQQAYNLSEKYLVHNKSDKKAFKLFQKIQTELQAINIKKIQEAIKKFDYLEKEKNYNDLLKAYLEIQRFAPDYQPLQKKIKQTYQHILKFSNQELQIQFKQIQTLTDQKLKEGKLNETISFLEQTIQTNPNNILIRKLLIETKRKIIDAKLKNNSQNLKSHNIPKIYDFLKNLHNFEPTYSVTQKLLIKYYKLLQAYYANQKLIFEKDSIQQIKILFNQKEFQKCLQASNELLRTTIYNKTALKYRKKAQSAIIGQNFREAYEKLKT